MSTSEIKEERFNHFDEIIALPYRIFISVMVMLLLAFLVYKFNVANPNMILVSGLVILSSIFGMSGGIPSAVVMIGYTLFFFSDGHDFRTFNEINSQKVIVSLIGIVIITSFICYLKGSENSAYKQLKHLTEEINEDNKELEEASTVVPLTDVHNRLFLRRNYNNYINKNVHVLMIDLDNFKTINDNYGHEAGDYALVEIAKVLKDLFGRDNSYRYGGDEFLVITDQFDEESFAKQCEELKKRVDQISLENCDMKISFSAGYVYGKVLLNDDLRKMFSEADKILYYAKSAGKNQIKNGKYIRRNENNI